MSFIILFVLLFDSFCLGCAFDVMGGVGKRKAGKPKGRAKTDEEWSEHRAKVLIHEPYPTLPTLGEVMNGKAYTRQQCHISDAFSLLRYGTPAHILPRLKELHKANSVGLWPIGAALNASTIHQIRKWADGLLSYIERCLMPECIDFGWPSSIDDELEAYGRPDDSLEFKRRQRRLDEHPLSKPLAEVEVADGGAVPGSLKVLCMPATQRVKHISLAHRRGYAVIAMGSVEERRGRKKIKYMKKVTFGAHHLVCWLFHGPPGKGQESGHLCGHPNCLNPCHLKWVSKVVNSYMTLWHHQNGRGSIYEGPFNDASVKQLRT